MTNKPHWNTKVLRDSADQWLKQKIAEKRAWKDLSPWWCFSYAWHKKIDEWLEDFVAGRYPFSPLKMYHFPDDVVTLWNCEDRLILFLLHQIIKPMFRHILSPRCFSAPGISGVKAALNATASAFKARNFKYVIRLDIKSYYASIDHKILLQQLDASFDDERLRKYLHEIVTIPIDKHAALFSPTKGIPRRSSLSPFFGALYLKPLDQAFEHRKGVFYARYMDDVLILFEKKGQFLRAKKRVKKVLAELKLKMSPHKTKMGKLDTFHFLGVNFTTPGHEPKTQTVKEEAVEKGTQEQPSMAYVDEVQAQKERADTSQHHAQWHPQQEQKLLPKTCTEPLSPHPMERLQGDDDSDASTTATRIAAETQTQVTMRLHPRSCRRALDKVNVMEAGAVHPAHIQCYLSKWAAWWKRASGSKLPDQTNLKDWVDHATTLESDLVWLGRGMLDFRLLSHPHLR